MDFGKAMKYNISIEPSGNNGFFVTVGCGRFAYTDKAVLIADLEEFLYDPEKMEKEYNKMYPQPVERTEPCNETACDSPSNPIT